MRRALVTGCSTGIGFATALSLARDGFDVTATMRDPERDGAVLRSAAADAGLTMRVVELDVTDNESVARVFGEVGDLDVLVNNAGVMWFGSVEETDLERWRALFDTNVFGAVRCMRAVLPIFRASRGGCIINVSSPAGAAGVPGVGAYGASKAALESASEVVAIEGRTHGIRVVVVSPGFTESAITTKVQRPSPDSPYAGSTRNTFTLTAALPRSLPEVIADAICAAALDPGTPFRVAVGTLSSEIASARDRMSDNEWIEALGGTTDYFVERFRQSTGVSLRN